MSAPESNQQRYLRRSQAVRRVLLITLGLNLIVAGSKIGIGAFIGNLTVLADGFHSLLDGANNLIALLAIYLAARPADAKHPYGHRKFEHVAAMAIGGLVVILAWELLRGVIASFRMGAREVAAVDPLWVALIAATLLINIFVAAYEYREGHRLDSSLLKADSKHTAADVMITVAALASLLLTPFVWWIDPVLALIVIGFLITAALSILRDNIATMTDQQRLDPERVRAVAESVSGVLNAHAIRSHGMENDVHLDLHIIVKSDLRAGDVSLIESHVRRQLTEQFPETTHVTIHHETMDQHREEEREDWDSK